jgi:hypothetical protein
MLRAVMREIRSELAVYDCECQLAGDYTTVFALASETFSKERGECALSRNILFFCNVLAR